MSLRAKLFDLWMKKRPKNLSPMKIIAVVFAGIILLGAALLSLPVSSRSGISCGFLPALFTATSATCVTGLSLYDTFTQWSGFGQTVIICLIVMVISSEVHMRLPEAAGYFRAGIDPWPLHKGAKGHF